MVDYINDIKRKEIEAQKRDNLKWLYPIGAGLGAVALGSFIYKSTFAGQGGNVVANLLHFMGRPNQIATNVDKIANTGASEAASGASGIKSWLTSTFNLKTKEVQLGPVDLITDLGASLEILGSRTDVRQALTERFTEHINRRFANRGNNVSFFSQNLQRVTVNEVLGNEGQWSRIIGQNQWNVLKKASDVKLVQGTQELDRFLFKTNKGFLRDLRPSHWVDTLTNLIPFGQGGVFKSLLGERQGIGLLKNTAQVKGDSYFVGGNVYAYTKNPKKYKGIIETLVATNQKLRNIGDRLEPIRAAKEGRLEFDLKVRTGKIGKAITAFERATGVGTSFQNRYSFLQRWVTNPIRRLAGLVSGKTVLREARKENAKGALVDEFAGANLPELLDPNARGRVVVGNQVGFSSLPAHQKFLTIFNRSGKYDLVTPAASARFDKVLGAGVRPHAEPTDFFTPPQPRGGITIKKNVSSGFYTAPRSRVLPFGTSVRDLASYLVYRTSHLASESLLGISFAPAKTLLGNATRLAAIPLIYEAGRQAYNYADYLAESATGISPTKLLASAYASARVFQQKIREATGIQQASAAAENNFPGSVDSGLGYLLRSAAAPMGVFAALAKTGRIGAAVAGAIGTFAAIGGTDPGQTSEALQQEYEGKIKVPIRKGRFWGLGNTPFEGGEIERFDYSWYHKLMKDPKTKSIYGSDDEYWKYHANVFGVPLPTPSNLFGLRNILNPYRLEELNKDTRPYEQSGSGLEEFPIFGPMLASTVGKVIKPTLFRAGVIQEGLNTQTARDLGLPDIVASEPNYDSPVDRVQKMANVALEPLGVYKFAMEYFGLSLEPRTEQLATSNLIDSPGKNFYAMNLGGGFSNTEFLRRFLMSDYSSTSNLSRLVNRVPNASQDWLPGSGSSFEKDRDYYLDFHMGNPFDKLAGGESRLPGPGYEAVAELESGRPGEYSPVDRLLILADVAPWSEAYASYDKQVMNMALSPEWQQKVDLAREYKRRSTSIENRYPRYADSLIALNEHIHDSAAYKSTRQAYDFITHDVLAEIPLLGSKIAPFRDPYEKYRKQFVEGSEFASWYTPWEDIQRPALTDMALANPVMGAVKGAALGYLLSSPAFLGFAAPMTAGPMTSITAGALVGGGLSVGRLALGVPSDYVPNSVVEQSETIQYLDALQYTKSRAWEINANEQGLSSKEFVNQKRKTMVGANTQIMLRASLPSSSDKKYFDVFLNTPGPNREALLAGVSPHMSYALNKAWTHGYGSPDSSDQEAMEVLGDQEIPAFDSLAWHPAVDNKSMGLKIVSHGLRGTSDNYHKYGFYESHEATLRSRLPDLWNESTSFTQPPKYYSGKDHMQNVAQNIGGRRTSMFATPFGARYTQRLQIDRSNETLEAVRGR